MFYYFIKHTGQKSAKDVPEFNKYQMTKIIKVIKAGRISHKFLFQAQTTNSSLCVWSKDGSLNLLPRYLPQELHWGWQQRDEMAAVWNTEWKTEWFILAACLLF